jgi:hypothetical protein
MTVYRVYNRRLEGIPPPRQPKGVMSTWDVDVGPRWHVGRQAEAETVAQTLNEQDREPEYGDRGGADWIVVDDREPPRPI